MVKQLEQLASELIGDGHTPDIFFVTKKGKVRMITLDFQDAYHKWKEIASKQVECALENRTWGVICSFEQDEETDKLVKVDDSRPFLANSRVVLQ